jgi:hypothetical protein
LLFCFFRRKEKEVKDMKNERKRFMASGMMLVLTVVVLCSPGMMVAGDLEPPTGPTDPAGAMYTLDDIYNRLNMGAPGTKRSGGFADPASGPASTYHTLDEVMGKAPVMDDANGASAADVAAGKTFWGLTSGEWGEQTGSGDCLACNGTMNGARWCDNEDGTVTDMNTGLIWLKDASWGGLYAFWVDAKMGINAHDRAAQLWDGSPQEGSANISDGSVEGDWRLPTRTELEGLANGDEAVSTETPRAFTNVFSWTYWSSTTKANDTGSAWAVYLFDGSRQNEDKSILRRVWPVRGGH